MVNRLLKPTMYMRCTTSHSTQAMKPSNLNRPMSATAEKREIVAMREKVRAAHPLKPQRFDLKHSPGGMVDAEFAVQFLVLSQSARHPELVPNLGNIALLQRAEACGLLPACGPLFSRFHGMNPRC